MPNDLYTAMYVIIDTKENVDNFINIFNQNKYASKVNLITYRYRENINGIDYWYLKITNALANKENCVEELYKKKSYNKLIVAGSGRSDIPLIKDADLSICLSTAPDYIKDEVDIIIDDNPENVLRIFDKIYHSSNIDLTIEKLKTKYKK